MSWLFEKIANWISGALEKAFSFLGDLLVSILWPFVKAVGEFIYTALAGVFYHIFVSILHVIDAVQLAFNVFSGLDNVQVGPAKQEMSLMTALFRMSSVQNAFVALLSIAMVLCVMFAVIGVLRSISDFDGQNGRPVSRVLSMSFKAMIRFITIPLLCLIFIVLADTLLSSISIAMGTKNSTISRILFVTATMDAAKDQSYNVHPVTKDKDGNEVRSDTVNTSRKIGIDDEIRKPFYTGQKNYADESAVKAVFELKWMDFITGFFTSIFMILIMGMACFSFICRIFDCIVLMLVSPFFIATMPMDDGERYKSWQDLFIGKLFSGFGTVVSMQLYLIICPLIMSNEIVMLKNGSVEAEYLIRLLFLLGGAWAVTQSGPMITSLLNDMAASGEMQSNAVGFAATAGGMRLAAGTALFTAKLAGKAVSAPFRSGKKDGGKKGGEGGEGGGKEKQGGGGFGAPSLSKKKEGGGASGGGSGTGGSSGKGGISLKEKGVGEGGFSGSGGTKPYGGGVQTKSFLGGLITRNKRADGSSFTGFNFGFMKRGYDEKGNYGFKVFGMGSKVNKQGVKSWSFLGQRVSKDQNGKLHWTKRNFGLFAMKKGTKYDAKTGKFAGFTEGASLSKIGLFGVKRKYNSATGKFQTQSALGMKFGVGTDGKNHVQSWGSLFKNDAAIRDSAQAAKNWDEGLGLDGKGGEGGKPEPDGKNESGAETKEAPAGGKPDEGKNDPKDITKRGLGHLQESMGISQGKGSGKEGGSSPAPEKGDPIPPKPGSLKKAAATGNSASAPAKGGKAPESKGSASGSGKGSQSQGGGKTGSQVKPATDKKDIVNRGLSHLQEAGTSQQGGGSETGGTTGGTIISEQKNSPETRFDSKNSGISSAAGSEGSSGSESASTGSQELPSSESHSESSSASSVDTNESRGSVSGADTSGSSSSNASMESGSPSQESGSTVQETNGSSGGGIKSGTGQSPQGSADRLKGNNPYRNTGVEKPQAEGGSSQGGSKASTDALKGRNSFRNRGVKGGKKES